MVHDDTLLERIVEAASPQPSLTRDGKLDAGPNRRFDATTVSADAEIFVGRQRDLIKRIGSILPANAPVYLVASLRAYDEELAGRGAQPILPLLKDCADIVAGAIRASSAELWLERGLQESFDEFQQIHHTFVEYFPADPERERLYAKVYFDEGEFSARLIEPLKVIEDATQAASQRGLVTRDFALAVARLVETAHLISTLPDKSILSVPQSVSSRMAFSAIGFLDRTFELIGSSATTKSSHRNLFQALEPVVRALVRSIHPREGRSWERTFIALLGDEFTLGSLLFATGIAFGLLSIAVDSALPSAIGAFLLAVAGLLGLSSRGSVRGQP